MRPERQKSAAIPNGHNLNKRPSGIVSKEYQTAHDLFLRGKIDESKAALEAFFSAATTKFACGAQCFADATLLMGWCLIEKKEHKNCLQWLEHAQRKNFIAADNYGIKVLELNIQLFNEKYAEVQQAVEHILPTVTEPTSAIHAELRLLLGAALRWQGKLDIAIEHVKFANAAFTVLNEPGRQSVAANFLGWTYLSAGKFSDARRWFENSLQINTSLGATLRQAQNYQNLAIICYKQGDYQQSRELLNRELELVPEKQDMRCRAKIALGNVLRLQGEFIAARSSLHEAYSFATEANLDREKSLTLEFLGDVHRDEGNATEARRYYKRANKLALALAARGDLVMELLRREGECLDLEGRFEDSRLVLNEALTLCLEVGDRYETAVTQRCLGVNSANLEQWKIARENLTSALSTFNELGARHESMIAYYQLATILIKQIDTGNAGTTSGNLLVEAWQHALAAYQLNNELNVPILRQEIRDLVNLLVQRRSPARDVPVQPASFSTRRAPASRVVAVSRAMQNNLREIDGFARFDNPVLILGESGSSKKLLARRLHENSARGAFPFIRISCSATAVDVLTNELFGFSSGQGSGSRHVPGLIAQAEGGTLLLDGIGDLPKQLQSKIVELLQTGIYRVQGSGREQQSNVRIVATSDLNLPKRVHSNRFRKDLYFCLQQMSVTVAPLRRRQEDTLPLLDFFLARLEGSAMTARKFFDFQALNELKGYHWPGGTAELESISQQAWLNRALNRTVVLRRVELPTGPTLEFINAKS